MSYSLVDFSLHFGLLLRVLSSLTAPSVAGIFAHDSFFGGLPDIALFVFALLLLFSNS